MHHGTAPVWWEYLPRTVVVMEEGNGKWSRYSTRFNAYKTCAAHGPTKPADSERVCLHWTKPLIHEGAQRSFLCVHDSHLKQSTHLACLNPIIVTCGLGTWIEVPNQLTMRAINRSSHQQFSGSQLNAYQARVSPPDRRSEFIQFWLSICDWLPGDGAGLSGLRTQYESSDVARIPSVRCSQTPLHWRKNMLRIIRGDLMRFRVQRWRLIAFSFYVVSYRSGQRGS
jgi:hypothetical protein